MLLCNCLLIFSCIFSWIIKNTFNIHSDLCVLIYMWQLYIHIYYVKLIIECDCTSFIARVKECKHSLLLKSTTLLYPTTCAVLKLLRITAFTTVKKENVCISDHTVWNRGACFHFQTAAPDCPKIYRKHEERFLLTVKCLQMGCYSEIHK